MGRYAFTGAPSGISRLYYRSTYNTYTYDFYLGNAPFDVRTKEFEPHRSEVNGLYFDGDDYMSQGITGTILTFNKKFSVDMWIRPTESTISQNYYLF